MSSEGDILVNQATMKMEQKIVHGVEMKFYLKLNACSRHAQMAAVDEMYNVQ